MSNTHSTRLHKLITALFLVSGILLTANSAKALLSAKLTGPGSLIVNQAEAEKDTETLKGFAGLHAAAQEMDEDDTGALIVGMLLVLAGFSFHTLYVVRHREPVHVRLYRERKGKKKLKRMFRFRR